MIEEMSYFEYDYFLKLWNYIKLTFLGFFFTNSVIKSSKSRDLSKSTSMHNRLKANNLTSVMVDLKMFIILFRTKKDLSVSQFVSYPLFWYNSKKYLLNLWTVILDKVWIALVHLTNHLANLLNIFSKMFKH